MDQLQNSAFAAGCERIFTGPGAVYAALGASLAGARALAVLDKYAEIPDSRVTGGLVVAMPGAGEGYPSLAAAFAASEREDRAVTVPLGAGYAAEAAEYRPPKYRKQPERFVQGCGREELCPGCPYRAAFYLASKLWLRTIAGGGCSLLGAKRPFLALDAAWGRGTALAALSGFIAAMPEARRDTVAVCGLDEAGADGLALLAGSGGVALLIGEGGIKLPHGVEAVELDAYDVNAMESALRTALEGEGAALLLCRGGCGRAGVAGYRVDANRCRRCGACGRLGCPAISGRSPVIDPESCVGCGLCAAVCKCSAIVCG